MPQTLQPSHPVFLELASRLHTRVADLKGDYSNAYTASLTSHLPPFSAEETFKAILLPGTLSLTPSPPEVLQSLIPHLQPEGVILGWVLGEGSLPELHQACAAASFPSPSALPAVQDVGALLQRLGLALPVVDKDTLVLTFPTFARLLHHVKSLGLLQRPSGAGLITPRHLAALEKAWPPHPKGFALTLNLIFFHAVRPSALTPKAAPRGSGKVSMVKILAPDTPAPTCQSPKNT
jgi:hypothetical protein